MYYPHFFSLRGLQEKPTHETDITYHMLRLSAIFVPADISCMSLGSFPSREKGLRDEPKFPGGGGGGGGTPIYGLYRYVPCDRVCFLRFSVLK